MATQVCNNHKNVGWKDRQMGLRCLLYGIYQVFEIYETFIKIKCIHLDGSLLEELDLEMDTEL